MRLLRRASAATSQGHSVFLILLASVTTSVLFFNGRFTKKIFWTSFSQHSNGLQYSTHLCYDGVSDTALEVDGFADDAQWRICLFRNVCFDYENQSFQYFSSSKSEVFSYPWDNGSGFPEYFLNLDRSCDTGSGPFTENNPLSKTGPPIKFSLQTVWNEVPASAEYADSLAHYLTLPFSTENFGHVLLDLILPAYHASTIFGMAPRDTQLLVGRALDDVPGGCSRAGRDLLAMLFRKKETLFRFNSYPINNTYFDVNATTAKILSASARKTSKTCFRNLIAGSGRTGLSFGGGPIWTQFIDFIISSLGRKLQRRFTSPVQKLNILLLFKNENERRATVNAKELAVRLANVFPVHVQLVFGKSLSEMSLTEQLRLIMDTAVLVTDAGGMSTLSAFMRPNTACVILSYHLSFTDSPARMENKVWRYETRRKILHFPVHKDEIDLMHPRNLSNFRDYMERQWESSDFWKYRNFGRTNINIDRMIRYVDAAMRYVSLLNSIPMPDVRFGKQSA